MLYVIIVCFTGSFVAFIVGMILAPLSVNKEVMSENDLTTIQILEIPNLFQKKWYREDRQFVRLMVVSGFSGLLFSIFVLYLLKRFELV